jgi:hypothetical protein
MSRSQGLFLALMSIKSSISSWWKKWLAWTWMEILLIETSLSNASTWLAVRQKAIEIYIIPSAVIS